MQAEYSIIIEMVFCLYPQNCESIVNKDKKELRVKSDLITSVLEVPANKASGFTSVSASCKSNNQTKMILENILGSTLIFSKGWTILSSRGFST